MRFLFLGDDPRPCKLLPSMAQKEKVSNNLSLLSPSFATTTQDAPVVSTLQEIRIGGYDDLI